MPPTYIVAGGGGGRKGCAAIGRSCPAADDDDVGGGSEGPAGTWAGAFAMVETMRGATAAAGAAGSGAAFCSSSPISAANSANSSSISCACFFLPLCFASRWNLPPRSRTRLVLVVLPSFAFGFAPLFPRLGDPLRLSSRFYICSSGLSLCCSSGAEVEGNLSFLFFTVDYNTVQVRS